MSDLECRKCGGGGALTVPDGDGESASEQACPDPVHDGTATPGQALSPDPANFAYHVRATAFNVLTGKMAGDEWSVPRSERDAIARAVVDAVEPLIRADERAVAAREPHAAPGIAATDALRRFAQDGEWLSIGEYGTLDPRKELLAVKAAVREALRDAPEPQPAPELAAAVRETRELRAGIAALIPRLDASAAATRPSRKSQIEDEIAIALRKLLEGK